MSFQEKSTAAVLLALLVTYGWYFADMFGSHGINGYEGYQFRLLGMLGLFIALVVIAHIVLASADPKGSDENDERDREIDRFGEYIGSYAMGAQSVTALGLVLFEMPYFLIAHVILGGLVAAEIVSSLVKLWLYRRGF